MKLTTQKSVLMESKELQSKYVHPPLTKSPLAKLAARDEAETRLFLRQMRMCGIAVVSLEEDDPRLHVFDECAAATASFFEQCSREEKCQQKMKQEQDWGYVEMEGVKEFWQMRSGASNPWPVESKHFFDTCTDIAEICLASLARGLGTQECELVEKARFITSFLPTLFL